MIRQHGRSWRFAAVCFLLLGPVGWAACGGGSSVAVDMGLPDENVRNRFAAAAEALTPLHEAKRPPGPSDWLAHHEERGQTFDAYAAVSPPRPTAPCENCQSA